MPDGRISQAGGRRMAIDESMKPQWERERKERGRDLEQAQTLQSGGGGGTYDGMEARVAKLESGVDEIKKSLTDIRVRSEEHTSELQSLMRISYAVFCLNTKK